MRIEGIGKPLFTDAAIPNLSPLQKRNHRRERRGRREKRKVHFKNSRFAAEFTESENKPNFCAIGGQSMKNDLRDEILHLPSSRPAPTPALRSLHPPSPQKACAVRVASLRGRGRGDGVLEAPDGTRAHLHPSHESGWRQPVTHPLKIFTFEAFFMKSLLMAQSLG